MHKPIIIAHRGASAYAPENTISSFRKALDMKAGGIEIDVHLTKDGHVVVTHDERLGRTCNGSGLIKDLTLDELKKLDFGSWFSTEFINERIPTLDETLDLLANKDILLNIEIKSGSRFYPGIVERVVNLTNKYNMIEQIIISSFDHYCLREVKSIAPQVRIGLLYSACLYDPAKYAKMVGAEAIHPYYLGLHPDSIKPCKANNILINAWTINAHKDIEQALLSGIDGIITNYPDVAVEILERTIL